MIPCNSFSCTSICIVDSSGSSQDYLEQRTEMVIEISFEHCISRIHIYIYFNDDVLIRQMVIDDLDEKLTLSMSNLYI